MNTFTGSPIFMAPEILLEQDYTYKVDVYAYSILMYAVITGKDPYPEYKSIVKFSNAVCGGKRPDLTYIEDEYIKNLLKKCWSQNSEERPSFEEIVNELKSVKFRKLMLAKTDEVNSYLQFFGEKLDEIEEDNKDISDIKKKADSGDDRAMLNYTIMLSRGKGVPVNKKEAARYFKMSADKGNDIAMLSYAFRLSKGIGVPVNNEESTRYLKMSADKGNHYAMNHYAFRLSKGIGVPVNKKEAVRYFKMSADKGNASSMNNYAIRIYYGIGVPVNKEVAANYLKMSADKGNIKSMNFYAIMLENGDGIPPDREEAIRYFTMAKEKGNLKAKRNLSRILNSD